MTPIDIKTRFLFRMNIQVDPARVTFAPSDIGIRQTSPFTGTFQGDGFAGTIVDGTDAFLLRCAPLFQDMGGFGAWAMQHPDDELSGLTDVRCTLRIDEGAGQGEIIYMAYQGLLVATGKTWLQLQNPASGLQPCDYYWRTTPYFEASGPTTRYLNHRVGVGTAGFTYDNGAVGIFDDIYLLT
jgi:hypothetical protein